MKEKFLIISITLFPVLLNAQQSDDSTVKWSGAAEAYYYSIPAGKIYPTLITYADHSSLHLEARYNYEDYNTASVHVGYNIEKDGKFSYTFTPMIGVAAGLSYGIMPGFECSATYSSLNFYSENEYMFNFKGRDEDFFYSWTQLSTNTFKNFQVGLLAESLKLYKTKFAVDKGFYAEYAPGKFLIDFCYLNPLSSYDYFVAAVTYNF